MIGTVTRNNKSQIVVWKEKAEMPTCTCRECAKWKAPCRHALAHAKKKGWKEWENVQHTFHKRWHKMDKMVVDPVAIPGQAKADKISFLGRSGVPPTPQAAEDQGTSQDSQRQNVPREHQADHMPYAAEETEYDLCDEDEAPEPEVASKGPRLGPTARYNALFKQCTTLTATLQDLCKHATMNRSNQAVFIITQTILVRLADLVAHADVTDLARYGETLSRSIAAALQPFGFKSHASATAPGSIHDPETKKGVGRQQETRLRSNADTKTSVKDATTCGLCGQKGHKIGNKQKCSMRATFGHQITAEDWGRRPDHLPGLENLWLEGHEWTRVADGVEFEGTTQSQGSIPSSTTVVVIEAAYVHNAQSKDSDGAYLCMVRVFSKKTKGSSGLLRIANIEYVKKWHNDGKTGGGKYAYLAKPAAGTSGNTGAGRGGAPIQDAEVCTTCKQPGPNVLDLMKCSKCNESVHLPSLESPAASSSSGAVYCSILAQDNLSATCMMCESSQEPEVVAPAPEKKRKQKKQSRGEKPAPVAKKIKPAQPTKASRAPTKGGANAPRTSKRPHEPSRRLIDAGAAPSKKQKPTFSSAFNFSDAVLEAAVEDKGFASAWDEAQ
jgi:hypothetical protein